MVYIYICVYIYPTLLGVSIIFYLVSLILHKIEHHHSQWMLLWVNDIYNHNINEMFFLYYGVSFIMGGICIDTLS